MSVSSVFSGGAAGPMRGEYTESQAMTTCTGNRGLMRQDRLQQGVLKSAQSSG
jgi:hypothetical protein